MRPACCVDDALDEAGNALALTADGQRRVDAPRGLCTART